MDALSDRSESTMSVFHKQGNGRKHSRGEKRHSGQDENVDWKLLYERTPFFETSAFSHYIVVKLFSKNQNSYREVRVLVRIFMFCAIDHCVQSGDQRGRG